MTSVTIPNSVTSIGNGAFSGCFGLTSVTIPNSVTSIGEYAFSDCSSLTSVTIGNSVTSIGKSAFYKCKGLTSVTIPNSVTSIGERAFYDCTSLTSVTIPNSVTSIGNEAFYNCTSLTSVTIPNSVTSIGNSAFNYCTKLTSIFIECIIPPTIGSNAFPSNSGKIYVPCEAYDEYVAQWNTLTLRLKRVRDPFEIVVNISDIYAGNVDYPQSSCNEADMFASANYGYHFVQWSDGIMDNPRTIELTKDTTLTAEFAKNTYSVTTESSNTERGTTTGDSVALYLDEMQISASANYGYHFAQWSDGNVDNPRTIVLTKDTIFTAEFAKNNYSIYVQADELQGTIHGGGTFEYLDLKQIEAIPNYGYHFVQWSDGNKDNPRTIELIKDTTFTATFALDVTGVCGDDNLLTWAFDADSKTLTIYGDGQLNSNYTYGVQAPEQTERLIIEKGITSIGNAAFEGMCSTIATLVLPSTVTSIGDYAFAGMSNRQFKTLALPNTIKYIGAYAFDGAAYLQTIHFGSTLEEIGAYAFNGCTRVKEMTCLAEITPNVGQDGLISISSLAELHVPADYLTEYQLDNNWNRFLVKPMGTSETTTKDDKVIVVTDDNTATFTWPTNPNAASYTIQITKDGEVFCTLVFNANGQLTGIAFAPSRDNSQQTQAATMEQNAAQFTVTGLTFASKYGYRLEVTNASMMEIVSYSGEFATTGYVGEVNQGGEPEYNPEGIEDVNVNANGSSKILHEGQIYILRGEKVYTVTGQEVR